MECGIEMLSPRQKWELEQAMFHQEGNKYVFKTSEIYIEVDENGKFSLGSGMSEQNKNNAIMSMENMGFTYNSTPVEKPKVDIGKILTENGFEYFEPLKSYVQKFKTHLVMVTPSGNVKIFYYPDFAEKEMKDHEARINRWKQRFRKMGIDIKELRFS